MKKIMIVAMLFAGTVSTFAGDSPALKAILSIGTYDEAVKAVKANVNTLLNNEEKAKAYDHLVELAKKDYNAQSEISDKNTVYKQMGQNSKIAPYDTLKMGNAAVNVVENALLRYKYDNMPNEKGKIKPKYDGDKAVVYAIRTNLVNIAGGYWNNNNNLFEKFTGAYLDSKNEPFFAGIDTTAEKTFSRPVCLSCKLCSSSEQGIRQSGALGAVCRKRREICQRCFQLEARGYGEEL